MNDSNKLHKHKSITLIFLAGTVLLFLGCRLFSVEYWISRADTGEQVVPNGASVGEGLTEPNNPVEDNQPTGADCLEEPGDASCPLETCVVTTDQFSAKYVITSELYGKENPNNFSCCAGYQFTKNSNVELMAFEHSSSDGVDRWATRLYSKDDKTDQCSNYYSQHNGETTYWRGITEIVVIYANPHCDWIESNEPKLKNYIVPIAGICAP